MFFILKTYLVEKSVCFQYNIREIQLIQNINKKTLRHEHILIQVILHEVIQFRYVNNLYWRIYRFYPEAFT